MTTQPLTADQIVELEQLALEETKLAAEAAAIAERREQIKHLLRDRLGIGTHPLGACTVQVRAGARRLDTTALAQAYPVTQHPELYKPAIDTTAVKERIAPIDLAPFQVQGPPSVVVK